MRATTALLVFGCLLLSVSAADYYWPFSNEDAPNADIRLISGATVQQLEQACTADAACVGFNSNGWLKKSVAGPAPSAGCTLYVRRDVPVPASMPALVPEPQKMSSGTTVVGIASDIQFVATKTSNDLEAAWNRYKALIFAHPASSMSKKYNVIVSKLTVSVTDLTAPLQLNADESYTLTIPNTGDGATLTANTIYGAYRGLETFSQLVTYSYDMRGYQVSVAPVSITDFPRFAHRGLLVDTARHYQPVPSLKGIIDSLVYAKMNTFHWHMVDSQSFPMESRSNPLLWNGAYSDQEKYTTEDIQEVIEYARQRGIRVMVEFDMPGHAASWCAGYPDICPTPKCLQPLNPATNATFDLITSLLKEITGGQRGSGMFFDDLLHLGGDEVNTDCWSNTSSIASWMKSQGYTADQAYMYFVNRAHQIALSFGRDPVAWEEVFNHFGTQLDKRSIIHIWLSHATLAKVVAAGYRGILSNSDVWYLDHLGVTWEQFYLNDPFQGITAPNQQALVLGGEVCMWGETVDTSDVQQTIWPRAAAAAERLWSPASSNIPAEFLPRLESFRCLLNRRGIAAAPVNNANARQSPPGPGSCYVQ
jgi:hexosaminidase